MNKLIKKIIFIFILIQPLLDIITSYQIRNNMNISLGLIVRGLFFVFIILYMFKNKINKRLLIMFIIYFILAISYYFLYTKNNIFVEITNIIKIFYLPILILFFNNYSDKKINDKFIMILYLIYLNLIIIPYMFSFGFDIYKSYEHKYGFIGLFYSGNEISGILLGLMPIAFNYALKLKNYIIKYLFFIETIAVILIVGTKTLLIGFFIVSLYYIYKYFKKTTKKNRIITIIMLLFISVLFIIFIPKLNVSKNLKVALKYYKINKISDIKLENIDDIIFSKRIKNLKNIDKLYASSSKKTLLYGLGMDKILSIKDVEIDIFDLFFSIGIFGTIIYIIMIYQKIIFKNYYKLSLFLFILMSLFSGHIILEPCVSIFIALLFILNKNSKKDNKKTILLVSNMYPSKKYPYFGSFVKNTKKILEDNNYKVDLSVKYRETIFINKLFSYIYFYIKTILKGMFNNYDYIYVHYISHSALGAILPKITSKNTKLVLNAHGNDVVADYEFEKKNIKNSKKYLKYADKVIVPSNYFKNIMIKNYNVDEQKLYVYPSGGVDTEKFIKKDIKKCKTKYNFDIKKKYIGYIGRIEKNKGYDVFLKAIKELEKERKIDDKKFLIIGTGSEENNMNKLIKELDILQYLEIRNMVSQDELVDIYNSLDVFIFPTYRKSESLGLVGLEAMSCEKIVIASKNYGPTDYIKDNKNGFFFEPTNYIDLKNKIIQVDNLNNEQKNKIVKKARETAIKYNVNNTKDALINVFKEKK